jgi:hypothetical protein
MMRDSSSVKLTWSLSRGPASGSYHQHHLAGITQRHGKGYQLFRYDIEQGESQPVDLDIPDYRHLLLYGSNTRDDKGRDYVVGRRDGNRPLIFQLEF